MPESFRHRGRPGHRRGNHALVVAITKMARSPLLEGGFGQRVHHPLHMFVEEAMACLFLLLLPFFLLPLCLPVVPVYDYDPAPRPRYYHITVLNPESSTHSPHARPVQAR